ncbi:PTS lactose/cellobiose transporter subunit IIA [Clostridium uliginosum]|uniref:PTS system, cellobiose-specific IIA component n=1 Tax=Clostridium uliginosum TaxID=119641 RepID=A0A1I1NET5_9CLOT|nr:PTS lactose/cellobiose transporter subunit IIA [Clostridium uliginosum]SFC93978.1 PTS system, cellobiose-specific IIA component [Clostridium uliginosum]
MEKLEEISFKLISNSGEARSLLFEALRDSREGNFEEAEKKINEAETSMLKAHESHFSLIQQEAAGDKIEISLLLMHAEDQLITTETLKSIVKEMILMNKKFSK